MITPDPVGPLWEERERSREKREEGREGEYIVYSIGVSEPGERRGERREERGESREEGGREWRMRGGGGVGGVLVLRRCPLKTRTPHLGCGE